MEGEGPPPQPLLRLERTDHDGVPHLELVGELDLSTASPLKLRLELIEREEPARRSSSICGASRSWTRSGLGILLAHRLRGQEGRARARARRRARRQIQDLFALTGTQDKFDWVPAPS